MLSTVSRTVSSRVYEALIFYAFCQLHHVAFDWLKSYEESHTPFPGPNA